jgi:hypothetical protein
MEIVPCCTIVKVSIDISDRLIFLKIRTKSYQNLSTNIWGQVIGICRHESYWAAKV